LFGLSDRRHFQRLFVEYEVNWLLHALYSPFAFYAEKYLRGNSANRSKLYNAGHPTSELNAKFDEFTESSESVQSMNVSDVTAMQHVRLMLLRHISSEQCIYTICFSLISISVFTRGPVWICVLVRACLSRFRFGTKGFVFKMTVKTGRL
jgi:hypothetical protein